MDNDWEQRKDESYKEWEERTATPIYWDLKDRYDKLTKSSNNNTKTPHEKASEWLSEITQSVYGTRTNTKQED